MLLYTIVALRVVPCKTQQSVLSVIDYNTEPKCGCKEGSLIMTILYLIV